MYTLTSPSPCGNAAPLTIDRDRATALLGQCEQLAQALRAALSGGYGPYPPQPLPPSVAERLQRHTTPEGVTTVAGFVLLDAE